MRGSFRAGLAGLLLAAAMTPGCAQRNHDRGHGSTASGDLETGLAAAPRGKLDADVRAVGGFVEVDAALHAEHVGPATYHALDPNQCQCLAAAGSSLGNLFDSERCVVQTSAGGRREGLDHADCAKLDVLRAAAQEARNRSAADALEQFYLIAENEAKLDLAAGGIVDMDDLLADIGRMRRQGMQIPLDETQFVRERITLVDQRVQLEAGIERLNGQLWHMLGIDRPSPAARIWPATDLLVVTRPIDVEAAVQDALAQRPELAMLRRLRSSLDTDSLAAARQALSHVDALLGSQPEIPCRLSPFGLRTALAKRQSAMRELSQRRGQLDEYEREREEQIANQVRQAAADVETRLRQIALAKEADSQWDARIEHLAGRATTGSATFAEVAVARLNRQKAKADLIGHVVGWKIALVRLKEAQGQLAAECQP
jgi:hypothetical protein